LVQATFNGSTNVTVASAAVPLQIEDFTLMLTNAQATIAHGGTASFLVQITPVGGQTLPGAISMNLSGVPSPFVATWSQPSIPAGSSSTALTLTLKTPDYPIGDDAHLQTHSRTILALIFLTGTIVTVRRRHRLTSLVSLLVLAAALSTTLSGCGSGWGSETFNLSISGTSGALIHSSPASIVSQ
jgi:hypothetical protein